MSLKRLLILSLLILASQLCEAQVDSTIKSLKQISSKYINDVNNKIDKYSTRVSSKTKKTLIKLSKWENRIKELLQKANPEAAEKLFGKNQLTFGRLLQKMEDGELLINNYKAHFDDYRDRLQGSMGYLEQQKDKLNATVIKPLERSKAKLSELENDVKNSEALEQFIKQRRKQLIDQAIKYIGSSKYLNKINKEAYYYSETLRNYKNIFQDKAKAEKTAMSLLNKIPAFKKFVQENSALAAFFHLGPNTNPTPLNLGGLQTRAGVQSLLQSRVASMGASGTQVIAKSLQTAHGEMNKLKNAVLKSGGNTSDAELPNFKPNQTKTKTFKQRLEFGANIQSSKNNSLLPVTEDIGLSIGYKLNDKSTAGVGASYKVGLGTLNHIKITHQGIGLRSFIDWKLKKQFFISGGYEMNYNAAFKNFEKLEIYKDWQHAALIGISKKINIKTKFSKSTQLQLLYDMLARQHTPVSRPILFRIGYNFK